MNKLKELRKLNRLTQTELADFIGITQNTYSYWENDKVKIDNESLKKLANFFDVTIDFILCREEIKSVTDGTRSLDDILKQLTWETLTPEQKQAIVKLVYGAEVERLEKENKDKK